MVVKTIENVEQSVEMEIRLAFIALVPSMEVP